jgi:mono/diheme cytochrome c family protein
MLRTSKAIFMIVAAGCLLAGGAVADPIPVGSAFYLTNCLTCQQHQPVVAGSPAGNFMTAWTGAAPQVVEQGVFGRPFGASGGPAAPPFAVVQEPQPPQYDAAVATDASGDFVLAWGATSNGLSSILAQRYDSTGGALGPVIEVASDAISSPDNPTNQKPAVAVNPNGGFYVAWIALPPAGAAGGAPPRVLARRFDATGAPLGGQIQVSTGLVLGDRPSICVDQSSRLIAVWTFVDAFRPFQPSKVGVAARRLRPRGAPIGPEIIIAGPTAATASAAVSCGRRNSWVVAWHANDETNPELIPVVAQIWNRAGQPLPPFLVVEGNEQISLNPSISHDPSGNFVVAWETRDGQSFGISARRFAPDASSASGEVQVATSAPQGASARPMVATLGTGEFVVVWEGLGGVFGQRFSNQP